MKTKSNMRSLTENEKNRINELLEVIKNTHSINSRDICKDLKCTREFIALNLLPAFSEDRVLVGRTEYDYIKTFKDIILDRGYYYDENKYLAFIFNNIKSITQQTIYIDNNILYNDYYYLKYEISRYKQEYSENKISLRNFNSKKYRLIKKHISRLGIEILNEKKPNKNRRSLTKEMKINYKIDVDIKNLTTIKDMLDYGDSREGIEKKIFSNGFVKIEISFLNNKTRTFFYDTNKGNYEDKTLITYEAYEKHILNNNDLNIKL